jgi:hypothetical protein
MKVFLAIGCPDQPSIPTISTADILLEGGLDSFTDKKSLLNFIVRTLTRKYLNSPLVENGLEQETARRRAQSIVDDHCVHRDFTTLLWHEGLQTRDGSRMVCSLLQGEAFNPLLIAICSGPTLFTPDGDFFDANPALFPVNLFEQVSIIKGCVNVFNNSPSGKPKNIGSGNAVKFAVGRVVREIANPWDLPRMFPVLIVIEVAGVSPNGPICDPDSDNSLSNLQSSVIVICRTKTAATLRTSMLSGGYFSKFGLLRSGGKF